MHRALLAAAFTASLLTSGFSPGPVERLWHLLSSFWGATATADAGCIWDPDGRCQPAPESQPDAGCIMDPNGGCQQGS